jgi:fructokinase
MYQENKFIPEVQLLFQVKCLKELPDQKMKPLWLFIHFDDVRFVSEQGQKEHIMTHGYDFYATQTFPAGNLPNEARAFLNKHGVNTTLLAVKDAWETGIVNVKLNSEGKPEYEILKNVAWDHIPFTGDMAKIAMQLDAVCFGTLSQRSDISRKSIAKFLDVTATECLRVFDINIRQNYYSDEVILSSLKHASALKINNEELPLLTNLLKITGNEEEQLKAILKMFELILAVLTCGSKGAWMVTENEVSFEIPPIPGSVVSTVGAGDSFTAAAIFGFLQKNELSKINKFANAIASYACTQIGAVPNLLEKLINQDHKL